MKLEILKRVKYSVATYPGVGTFHWLQIVDSLGVFLEMAMDMILPRTFVLELAESRFGRQRGICHIKHAEAGGGKYSAVNEGVALDGQCLRTSKVIAAMIVLLGFTQYPYVIHEAEFCKDVASLFKAAVNVSLIVGGLRV